jgi:hypothetical protein
VRLDTGESMFWRVTLGDETWDFDAEDLDVDQMISIEAETGKPCEEWVRDIQRGYGYAYKVLIWWLRGRKTTVNDVKFRIGDLTLDAVVRPVKPPKEGGKKPATKRSPSSSPTTPGSTSNLSVA